MTVRIVGLVGALVFATACGGADTARSDDRVAHSSGQLARGDVPLGTIGRVATAAEIQAWDIDVNPTGHGLPIGRGTHDSGAQLFAAKCAVCHGAHGEGMAIYPRLIGREPRDDFAFGRDPKLVKTIGNYWPYSTTLFDYVRRAMPLNAPGSLSSNEVYNLVAFLLAENGIIARDSVIDQRTLPAVRMPARKRFVRDDRTGGSAFR
jgi:S-disulfanyl-L-cysteine oxidoreductase SoxD